MARSRNRRVNYSNANRRLPVSLRSTSRVLPDITHPPRHLLAIEDRRTFHPEGEARPARSFNRARHRLVIPKSISKPRSLASLRSLTLGSVPSVVAFDAPKKVLICVRRRIRKEVLHAFRKTGKSGQRRPRRSFYSSISCRS